jgi:hypothetical protein
MYILVNILDIASRDICSRNTKIAVLWEKSNTGATEAGKPAVEENNMLSP